MTFFIFKSDIILPIFLTLYHFEKYVELFFQFNFTILIYKIWKQDSTIRKFMKQNLKFTVHFNYKC